MRRPEIPDDRWERIKGSLPGQPGGPGVTAEDDRLFVAAVLWVAKTGAPWRDLPERLGPWGSVRKRFDRWTKKGVWQAGLRGTARPRPGVDDHRRHRGPGAPARRRGRKHGVDGDQALGRSRGGSGTKIHILVDGLGNPVEFILTAGQDADVTRAGPLIRAHQAGADVLDKAYDSDAVVAAAKRQGAEAVTPSEENRKVPGGDDEHLDKGRKEVEWFISLIKPYRRVATRYEKTARDFLGFVPVASIMVLLR